MCIADNVVGIYAVFIVIGMAVVRKNKEVMKNE